MDTGKRLLGILYFVSISLFIVTIKTNDVIADGVGNVIEVYIQDPDRYAADTSLFIINNADSSAVTPSSPDVKLFWGRIDSTVYHADCMGRIRVGIPAGNYLIEFRSENTTFRTPISISGGLGWTGNYVLSGTDYLTTHAVIDGFDFDSNGTVSLSEREQSRDIFSTSCGGEVSYYGVTLPTVTHTPAPTATPVPAANPTATPISVPANPTVTSIPTSTFAPSLIPSDNLVSISPGIEDMQIVEAIDENTLDSEEKTSTPQNSTAAVAISIVTIITLFLLGLKVFFIYRVV